jgi:hypothetical protein
MKAMGDQLAEYRGSTAMLTRPGSRAGASSNAAPDGGARLARPARHNAPPTEAAGAVGSALLTEPAVPANAVESAWPGFAELTHALAVVNAAAVAAPGLLAMAGYVEAANFAATTEELSRTVDYLQILAAGTVDRTRTQAITSAATTRATRSWVTGWDNGTETLNETDAAWPAGPDTTPVPASGELASPVPAARALASPVPASVPASPADDGCRNTEEFLRVRLRIGITEARRWLRLVHDALPAATLTGDLRPARLALH